MTCSTEMTASVIQLQEELGSELIGRHEGARLREDLVRRVGNGRVIVDLAGIELMSPSFADELFAKLPAVLLRERRVRFTNASGDIRALARAARGIRATAGR